MYIKKKKNSPLHPANSEWLNQPKYFRLELTEHCSWFKYLIAIVDSSIQKWLDACKSNILLYKFIKRNFAKPVIRASVAKWYNQLAPPR